MKYLKEYNNIIKNDILNSSSKNMTQSDIDDIMDVFQDLIDDYNIVSFENSYDNDISYEFIGFTGSREVYRSILSSKLEVENFGSLEVKIFSPLVGNKITPFTDKKIFYDIDSFVERLKLMEYSVRKSGRNEDADEDYDEYDKYWTDNISLIKIEITK